MRILCGNMDCPSREGKVIKQLNEKDLLLIGDSFKCYYCRGYKFILSPKEE